MHFLGYNYRMTDIQAALGTSQMKKLDPFVERRREIVKRYNEAFSDVPGITIPFEKDDRRSSWHLYVIRLNPEHLNADRKRIFEALRTQQIGVNVHYIPVHYHPYYRERGYEKGSYPIAEKLYEEMMTLPLFPAMEDDDVQHVIDTVKHIMSTYSR